MLPRKFGAVSFGAHWLEEMVIAEAYNGPPDKRMMRALACRQLMKECTVVSAEMRYYSHSIYYVVYHPSLEELKQGENPLTYEIKYIEDDGKLVALFSKL